MPFYKRDGDEFLQAPNGVYGPGFTLTEETREEHEYPVDGWYWFANLDDAMAALVSRPAGVVTALQGMRAIASLGTETVARFNALLSALDPVADFETIAFFQKAQTWRRDDVHLIRFATALGIDDAGLDALFALAKTL